MIRDRIVELRRVRAADLRPHPRNWRQHPPAQREALQAVLDDVGYADALLARETPDGLQLIDGHLRAETTPDQEVPVLVLDLDDDEADMLLATLDPLAALATADAEKLESLLDDIRTESPALRAMLDDLAEQAGVNADGEVPDDPGGQVDRAEELRQKWGVEAGQLWRIPSRTADGEHRLICGDCTDAEVVARVMEGERAALVVTDPPYGIGREGIVNDDLEGLRTLFDGCLAAMPIENAVVIAFQSPRLEWVWLDAGRAAGLKPERLLWMYKPNDETFPWRGWLLKSEAIRVMSIGKPEWIDVHPYSHDTYSPTTLGTELEGGQGWHPSVKPIAIIADLAKRVGGIVFDPFLGSGTTLVACERLGRLGRGVEIDPGYVAVSLQRLADMGLQPELSH